MTMLRGDAGDAHCYPLVDFCIVGPEEATGGAPGMRWRRWRMAMTKGASFCGRLVEASARCVAGS